MLSKENLVIVPGTPTHTNLGDSAIAFAQMLFLKKCGISEENIIEIGFDEYFTYEDYIKKYLNRDARIMQLGGGNLGSQWLIFLPCAYLLGPVLGGGLLAVWLLQSLYRIIASGIFAILWKRKHWANIHF